jgi:hypothetical protein
MKTSDSNSRLANWQIISGVSEYTISLKDIEKLLPRSSGLVISPVIAVAEKTTMNQTIKTFAATNTEYRGESVELENNIDPMKEEMVTSASRGKKKLFLKNFVGRFSVAITSHVLPGFTSISFSLRKKNL